MSAIEEKPPLDPHPLSDYVAWAGNRNKEAILKVLKQKLLKAEGHVLEFASGSGMHINFFAPHFKHLQFHPSDKEEETFASIKKLQAEANNPNVADPIKLDLILPETWPNPKKQLFDAIFCINIFQVAPLAIAEGMMQCTEKLLKPEGFLLIYGPFQVGGRFYTSSNEAFHNTLRSAGVEEWGLKDIADLNKAAETYGLGLKEKINMPANNFCLIYGKEN
jgi:cyclopropane fatty-acyl-phospholipid synthase-like methyltransferase